MVRVLNPLLLIFLCGITALISLSSFPVLGAAGLLKTPKTEIPKINPIQELKKIVIKTQLTVSKTLTHL